jgi:hypothetical protein
MMLSTYGCAELEVFEIGRTPIGAMLVVNFTMKFLELLEYRRRVQNVDRER